MAEMNVGTVRGKVPKQDQTNTIMLSEGREIVDIIPDE